MEFRTIVDIPASAVKIEPHDSVLLVGSCFADGIGRRFSEERFPTTVNPYGTMYNPASILHTVERMAPQSPLGSAVLHGKEPSTFCPSWAFLTLGTNHVYREKATGEIVDNCQKRPANLFTEEELTVEQCADYLHRTLEVLRGWNPDIHVVLTVSPIRYRKYGYHESQLSKATLQLGIQRLITLHLSPSTLHYFPAYEIMNDELRDYRFYAADMLHPSEQAVDYIWERLVEFCFSPAAKQWLEDWRPVKQALAHKPFDADSEEYKIFMDKTMLKVAELRKKYSTFAL